MGVPLPLIPPQPEVRQPVRRVAQPSGEVCGEVSRPAPGPASDRPTVRHRETASNDFATRAGQVESHDSDLCSYSRTAPRAQITRGFVIGESGRAVSND